MRTAFARVVAVLFLGGIVGKLAGVLREAVFAWTFGTSATASSFRSAQAALLLPLQGFVSDTLSAGFVPRFAQLRVTEPSRAFALVRGLHAVLLVASVLIAILMHRYASEWVITLVPGLSPTAQDLAATMLRWMAFGLPPYVLTGVYSSALLAVGRGELAALRPAAQSAGVIGGTIAAGSWGRPELIAAGFAVAQWMLAGFGLALFLRLPNAGLRRDARWNDCLTEARLVAVNVWPLLSVPAMLLALAVLERRTASRVSEASIAALEYSRFVCETIVVLMAVPVGLAGLAAGATLAEREFRALAVRISRVLVLVGVPTSAVLTSHAEILVRILFARGQFDDASVLWTSAALHGLGPGLVFQALAYAAMRLLNGRLRHRDVIVATLVGCITSALGLLVMPSMLGLVGVGLALSLGSVATSILAMMRVGVLVEVAGATARWTIAGVAYGILCRTVLPDPQIAVASIFTLLYWGGVLLIATDQREDVRKLMTSLLRKERDVQAL